MAIIQLICEWLPPDSDLLRAESDSTQTELAQALEVPRQPVNVIDEMFEDEAAR